VPPVDVGPLYKVYQSTSHRGQGPNASASDLDRIVTFLRVTLHPERRGGRDSVPASSFASYFGQEAAGSPVAAVFDATCLSGSGRCRLLERRRRSVQRH